jgi:hypothetical protein
VVRKFIFLKVREEDCVEGGEEGRTRVYGLVLYSVPYL